jgi:hypothetical protein
MGGDRSYQAIADKFGVSKTSVVARAQQEDWQGRLQRLEAEAHEKAERKAVEDMQAVRARQLKAARFLQARALEALQSLPAEKGVKAAAALSIAWKHELLLLGEPTERQASVEETTKREMARWLVFEDGDEAEAG